ncbi:MAG TPA: recombinase family protein [Lachnospiraceae bacterium]|nr:recombinase family protein [Lachnospiraceae bacterium]
MTDRKGCAYIRVSTDRQEELSPDAQKRLIYDYAKKNNIELTDEDIFMDIGISGKSAGKRPEFQNMIANAKSKEHPYDVILVWKFSRFARNQEESIVYKALLKKNNVDVISISEPLVDGPFGSLIERIIEWMDEYYSIRLSGEVKRGMTEKALKHGYVSTAPYGYIHEKGNTPVINPKEATAVRAIFEKYVYDNASYNSIARWLNDHGYRTKQGSLFDTRRIVYILTNPFYIGKIRLNGNTYDAPHEHMVTDELFKKAGERYASEYSPKKRKPADSCAHWLSGMLFCPACGGSLGYNRGVDRKTGKSYPIFYCWKSGKGQCNERTSIPAHLAEKHVIDGLRNMIANNNICYDIIHDENNDDQYDMLRKKLDILDKKEKRAKAAYLDGIDELADYKENKLSIDAERKKIMDEIDELQNSMVPDNVDTIMYGSIQKTIHTISDNHISKETKSAAIRSICKKIDYDKAKDEMTFHLYFSI